MRSPLNSLWATASLPYQGSNLAAYGLRHRHRSEHQLTSREGQGYPRHWGPFILALGLALGLYATGCAPSDRAPVERLTTSADPSPNSTRMNVTQWNWGRLITVDGDGGIHAVFTQLGTTDIEYPADKPDPIGVNQLPAGQIFYKRSLDGGRTWSDDRPLTGPQRGTDSPCIAAAGSDLYVIFRSVDTDRLRVFFRRSADRGVTWSPQVAISDNPSGISVSPPAIAADGASVSSGLHVVWADGRPQMVAGQLVTTKEVYLTSSQDRGATFGRALSVSTPDGFSSWTPSVAAWADVVHVAWTDERNDIIECTQGGACHEEEYYRRSTDGGLAFGPETRLTFDPPGRPAESWAPSLAVWQDAIHVAFFDKRTGLFQVYYKRSLDGGATWSEDVLLSSTSGPLHAARPSLAVLTDTVHIAWFEFASFEADIRYSRSTDSGATWSVPENLTEHAPGAARLPSVAVTPDRAAHIIWYDTRHSDAAGPRVEIYYGHPGSP